MEPRKTAGLVVAACSLAACRTGTPDPRAADGSGQPATVVVSAAPAPSGAGALEKPDSGEGREPVAALLLTPAWAQLREQWQRLDAQTGPSETASPRGSQEAAEVGRAVEAAMDAVEREAGALGVDGEVVRTLRAVAVTRVQVLTGLEFRLMVSHMMPSDAQLATARVGAQLEQRVDALLELKKRGALPQEEQRRALDAICSKIHTLVALQGLRGSYRTGGALRGDSLEEIEKNLPADGAVREEIAKAIASARGKAPVIERMVADLER